MKTATFTSSLMPPLAAMPASAASSPRPPNPVLGLVRDSAQATSPWHVAQADAMPEPLCWRSEAFAEDLLDDEQPAPRARRGLLRRVAAAVLRR